MKRKESTGVVKVLFDSTVITSVTEPEVPITERQISASITEPANPITESTVVITEVPKADKGKKKMDPTEEASVVLAQELTRKEQERAARLEELERNDALVAKDLAEKSEISQSTKLPVVKTILSHTDPIVMQMKAQKAKPVTIAQAKQ